MSKWLKRREIVLIKGPRQSGKTTLLLHLKEKLGVATQHWKMRRC
ncbi:MAG: AAA family ATPase [Candidatus Aenigmatarchaeota archaeon]